jgi:ABC-type lipoprotein release transport system permease subunit
VAASTAAVRLIKHDVPEFITVPTLHDALPVFVVALATAVLASLVAVRRIERVDQAEAFWS